MLTSSNSSNPPINKIGYGLLVGLISLAFASEVNAKTAYLFFLAGFAGAVAFVFFIEQCAKYLNRPSH